MHKSFLRVLVIFLFVFSGIAKADDEFTNPAKPIYVDSSSDTLTIKLKANPTTGYSWYLQSIDSPWLVPLSHRYVPPVSQLAGAPGYDVWTFKIKPTYKMVPFYTEIELIYTRPWQVNTSPTVFRIFYRP